MFKMLIKRPVAVLMVLTALMAIGVVAAGRLPVSLMPDIDIPEMTVRVSSPQSSAAQISDVLLAPLARQLAQVPGLADMTCTASDGSGLIRMTFSYGLLTDVLFIDVNERVDQAMAAWPSGVERPLVLRESATDIPAFFINVSLKDGSGTNVESSAGERNRFMEMSTFCRQVMKRRLEQLPQVAMADMSGLVYPQLLVVPYEDRLHALGMTVEQLGHVISNANVRLGSLQIRDGEYSMDVHFDESLLTRQDIENVYLNLGGRVFQVKDLARVVEQPRRQEGMISANGKRCVTFAVIKRPDARMAHLKRETQSLIQTLESDFPDLEFQLTRDETELLDYSIDSMVRSLLLGALFAALVIFLFMRDLRSPLLVVMTIPTSLILTLLVFHADGMSINIISLSGLVLGIGMTVDNSIITIDSITQHWQRGSLLADACAAGTREVLPAMLASVLTTCAIFLPLMLMNGMAGALLHDQAMAVTITLVMALMVSVFVIPVLYSRLYHGRPCPVPGSHGTGRLTAVYEHMLKWFLRNRAVVWTVGMAALPLSVLLFMTLDRQKLPDISHSDTILSIDWNSGLRAAAVESRSRQLVEQLSPLVEHYTIMSGSQQFVLPHTSGTGIGKAVIYLKTGSPKAAKMLEEMASGYILSAWPQATFSFQAAGNLLDRLFSSHTSAVEARISCADGSMPAPGQLEGLLSEIRAALPNVQMQSPQWNSYLELVADARRMALTGVSYGQLMQHISNRLNAEPVMRISRGDTDIPVFAGTNEAGTNENVSVDSCTASLTDGQYIETRMGRVPLETLLSEARGRELKQMTLGVDGPYYPLQLDLKGRAARHAMDGIRDVVQQDGRFEVSFAGSYFTDREMVRQLCGILAVSLLLLYFILSAQFESLVQPLIIMSELAVDILAVLVTLWACGQSINLMSMIGMTVMCGIVINDSILKVDTINRLHRDGMELKRAIMEAGRCRLRAILMTSLTTILAILPMMAGGNMGSDLQYPMSLAIVSGMTVGTLASVFLVPVIYYDISKRKK